MRWAQLLDALTRERSAGVFLFERFFRWYSPYFSAYSFPLARANEYHADAVAAELCGAPVVAQALTGVTVYGDYLDGKFWPAIHKQADVSAQPSLAPYQAMSTDFVDARVHVSAQVTIEAALEQKTNLVNTHPALVDRLAALGESAVFAPPATGSTADSLLGASLQRITDLYDEEWKKLIAPSWSERHVTVLKNREALATFAAREQAGEELSADDAFGYALLIDEVGEGTEASIARLESLRRRAPEHAPAMYHLGLRLLARDDDAGIQLIEQCMAKAPDAVMAGCEVLFQYARKQGRDDDAMRYQRMYEETTGHLQKAIDEENNLTSKDSFEPHGLTEEALAALVERLRPITEIRELYLVRRRLKLQPEKDCHVLGFKCTAWWRWQAESKVAALQKRILENANLDGAVFVICLESDNARFAKRFKKVGRARIKPGSSQAGVHQAWVKSS
jgi:hypothetical protein